MHALKRLQATRIVSTVVALDQANWPEDVRVLRTAADEVLIVPPINDVSTVTDNDPYAIVLADASFGGVWLPTDEANHLLEHGCEWEVPTERPSFAQGSIAGIATKLWLEEDRVLFIVPAPYMAEFEERMH